MADTLAPEGYRRDRHARGRRSRHPQHLPYPREGGRKGLFRARPPAELKEEAAAGRPPVLIAVAGCVAQAEGEEIIRRAPAVDLVVGPQSYHRLPDLVAQAASRRVVDTEFPVEDKFDFLAPPAREKTRSRGVSAFVTVQEGCDKFCTFCVVPYTRGAGSLAAGGQDRRRGRAPRRCRRARGHADRPERQRLSRRGPGRPAVDARAPAASARRGAGNRAPALHHQSSARHGRELDRGASRPAGADAVPASAGAVGLRPHPRRHEPPPHARRLSGGRRPPARHASGPRAVVRFHRRLSGRERGGFRRHARARGRGRLCGRLLVQVFAAPGHAGRRDGAGAGAREDRAPATAPAGDRSPSGRLQRALPRHDLRRAVREAGQAAGPTGRPLALSAAGAGDGAGDADRRDRAGDDHRGRHQQPVRHARRARSQTRRRLTSRRWQMAGA